jgi:predicted nucleic acid-binding protein
MRILIDTNIILDQLLDNPGFSEESEQVMAAVDNGLYEGYICATTATNVFYILRKRLDKKRASTAIKTILEIFSVAAVDKSILRAAVDDGLGDFEDAVLYESAKANNIDIIVTRNTKDFRNVDISVMSPAQFLAL